MSTIKVNTITKRTGSTLTLGESGTTVTLACGATQTGFGRTGTVDWCTTAKTSPFTSVSGKGYFVNTTSGAVTVTLPASPSAGDIVSIADYTNTFQTNNVTLANNSSKIGGVCAPASLSTEGQSATFVYVDGTEGWKNVQDSTSNVTGNPFLVATGGTITTDGNFKIHTFTGDGTFTVSSAAICAANNNIDYLVIAGGGGGSGGFSGGGGAGGYRFSNGSASGCYSAGPSPLASAPLPVSVQGYPITVGGGGTGGPAFSNPSGLATSGSNSVFSTITSTGGGRGGVYTSCSSSVGPNSTGGPGGSGGGGGAFDNAPNPTNQGPGGTGNTPPVSPPQGNNGGGGERNPTAFTAGGGGGGASASGSNKTGPDPAVVGGVGGAGLTSCITASPVGRGGGGGGASNKPGGGGSGGTGGGGTGFTIPSTSATSGTTNTGGGGGGGGTGSCGVGGAGGSGIVVIRYKFQ